MKGIIRTSMEPGFDVAKINKILIIREWLRTPQRGNTTGQLNNSIQGSPTQWSTSITTTSVKLKFQQTWATHLVRINQRNWKAQDREILTWNCPHIFENLHKPEKGLFRQLTSYGFFVIYG